MRGADALVLASAAAGVEVCFANPGTTEMAMVDAIQRTGSMRAVLALFEGVASGAADGYARLAGKPASVMLHLGPGLGNATANLHNARRGQSPVVTWVGDHATWLLPYDPPLASDIESIARGTSQWVRTTRTAETMGFDAVAAVEAAHGPVAGVATLILPADLQERELGAEARLPPAVVVQPHPRPLAASVLEDAASQLRAARSPALVIGGQASDERAVVDAARIVDALGGKLFFDQFPRCTRRAPGLPSPERLGYLPAQARAQLAAHDVVVVVGADKPALYFGYPGEAPTLTAPGTVVLEPAAGGRDVHTVLAGLADALGAPAQTTQGVARRQIPVPEGALHPQTICQALAHLLPEDAIVVDEGITSSLPLYPSLAGAASHHYIACKGASIGFSPPVATGAAVAAPGRRVLCYVGDGSAAYTIQALWTQAREGLDVTTVVLVNHKYAILQMELLRSGGSLEGVGKTLTQIDAPTLDFVALGKGFGVPSREARDLPSFLGALAESFATPGPMLIAAVF